MQPTDSRLMASLAPLVAQWASAMVFDDTVAAIRQCVGSLPVDSEEECAECFAGVRRQWECSGDGDGAKSFVLLIIGCRLEERLLTWLLQTHVTDATEDLQKLVAVCEDPYLSTSNDALLKPVLDALLAAAILRAARCERNAEQLDVQCAALTVAMETSVFVNSNARFVLRALTECHLKREGATAAWRQFVALPHALDHRLFNSRDGRTFLEAANDVIDQQQVNLAASLGPKTETDEEAGDGAKSGEVLWGLAGRLVDRMVLIPTPNDVVCVIHEAVSTDSAPELSFVCNSTGLEKYLASKTPPELPDTFDTTARHGVESENSDIELSALEQLSAACTSCTEDVSIASELLQKLVDELSAVETLEVLTVHVSFLLGLQMRLKRCLIASNDDLKDVFERRIRRVFNCLTGDAQDRERAASLVVLSAFCPQQVIRQLLRGARADTRHHSFYLEVMHVSPLLLDWKEGASDETGPFLYQELQRTIFEVSNDQNLFDTESHNLTAFLESLVGIFSLTTATAIVTAGDLLQNLIPLCSSVGNLRSECGSRFGEEQVGARTQFNFYSILQLLVERLVTTNTKRDIAPDALRNMFAVVAGTYSTVAADTSPHGVLFREKLLLLLKDIMGLAPDPAAVIALEQSSPRDTPFLTLVDPFSNDLDNDANVEKLRSLDVVRAYVDDERTEDHVNVLPTAMVEDAIQVLLWKLLWGSMYSAHISSRVQLTKTATWQLLDAIAVEYFEEAAPSISVVKGSVVIQNAVATMMLECGSALFQALYDHVIPSLLKYEPAQEKDQEEVIKLPEWVRRPEMNHEEAMMQLKCQLLSAHRAMYYVVKSWSLIGAKNPELGTPPSAMIVESLRHVICACNRTIAASQSSLSGQLYCFQWVCFLVSTAYGLQLDTLATWSVVQTQLELSLLRVMRHLDQLSGISEAQASFSQHFVASCLASIPTNHFGQVCNFLASRVSK
ncbi:hypothetical protein BBJ28_00023329 [Nothophytophthora sp. Chile5]|nr:hypothetical protein BBJ28_00023329 [Nothophytophthora sp. Chile5]